MASAAAPAPAKKPHPPGLHDCLWAPIKASSSRLSTLAQIGEDWLYLALLGIIMALLSFSMDSIITLFLNTRLWLSHELGEHGLLWQYLAWCMVPILLVTFSTGFVHLCSPTAIGSGIPEMKTILRGVVLNEYLTFRTLIAKIVGLTFTLGSGLPLGKEGPFVHMASIVATLLSKLVASFQGIYENESRTSEMLSAACAVGVAATFYAPIGGVLFSIEVTTVYFAVRNYWRGFFAACCGATIWRLLSFYVKNDESISALFKTNFSTDYPFDPIELLVFSFIGATSGLAGAAYIKFHREIVQFFRRHKRISGFFQQNRFVYPILITLIITTSTFPPFLGKYTASTLSTHTTIEHLFSNRTWGLGSQDLVSKRILDNWTTEATNFYLHLVLYIVMLFWTSALASTIPIPSGIFIPVLKMGAAYGRLLGELMAAAYPNGIKYGGYSHPASIVPGSYAVVGAAAFSGAVTHTISTSVILFEMTGQIVHIIPVILGVLISNAVCQSLQPSIYDSIIEIKKLPYLPPIASSNSIAHRILVRDFMNTNLPYVWREKCTYADLKRILSSHKKIISFPLVDSPRTMKLLGSVARPDLLKLLYLHLGRERRLQEIYRRNSETGAAPPTLSLLNTISGRLADEHAAMEAERRLESELASRCPGVVAAQDPAAAVAADRAVQLAKLVVGDHQQPGGQNQPPGDNGLELKMKRSSTSTSSTATATATDASSLSSAGSSSGGTPTTIEMLKASIGDSINANASDNGDSSATCLILRPDIEPKSTYGATTVVERRAPGMSGPACSGDKIITRLEIEEPTGGSRAAGRRGGQGEERLLADCSRHKEWDSAEDGQQQQHQQQHQLNQGCKSVARMINHYDRGSSMDEDHLEKSIQEMEEHLATVNKCPPDVVVLVSTSKGDHKSVPSWLAADGGGGGGGDRQTGPIAVTGAAAAAATTAPTSTVATGGKTTTNKARSGANPSGRSSTGSGGGGGANSKPLAPLVELKQSSSFNNNSNGGPSQSPSLSSRPTKSILKTSSTGTSLSKRNISTHSFSSAYGPAQMQLAPANDEMAARLTATTTTTPPNVPFRISIGSSSSQINDLTNGGGSQEPTPVRQRRKVRLPRLRVVDMTPEEQEQWEKEQLSAHIDISRCQIDEAPFQLVEQTSLYRVHTLFSMLGLNHAYVTSFGRLVGIVALKDIRLALEKILQEK